MITSTRTSCRRQSALPVGHRGRRRRDRRHFGRHHRRGGGLVNFRMFVYIFRRVLHDLVWARTFPDHFTAGLGAIAQYASYGFVFYHPGHRHAARVASGHPDRGPTTKVVKGIHIRGLFALSISAGFINRARAGMKLVELENRVVQALGRKYRVRGQLHLLVSWWPSSASGSSEISHQTSHARTGRLGSWSPTKKRSPRGWCTDTRLRGLFPDHDAIFGKT